MHSMKGLEAERIRCDVLIEHYRQSCYSAQDSKSEKDLRQNKGRQQKEHAAIVLMGKRQ